MVENRPIANTLSHLVLLLGVLIGVILAFQSSIPMRQFGAEIFIPRLVGISLLRELGPLLAGVVLAVQRGGHIAVEWLMGKLGRGGKRSVLLAGHALVTLAYAWLCWQALVVAEIVAIERSPALGLPGSTGYWAIAAGCALIAVGTATIALRVALLGPEAMPQPSPEEMPT